jgi:hypothetical protein
MKKTDIDIVYKIGETVIRSILLDNIKHGTQPKIECFGIAYFSYTERK